jgi:ABC-type transport system involved in multi-copper enzyme maturation permease subunit
MLFGLILVVLVAIFVLGGTTTVEILPGKTTVFLLGTRTHSQETLDPSTPLLYHLACIMVLLWGTILLPTTLLVLSADAVPRAFLPGAAEITLTKPIGRWEVVVARALGAIALALALELLLVGGAAGAAWVRTGVSTARLLAAVPALVLAFTVLHALATLAGIVVRNPTWGLLGGFGGLIFSAILSATHYMLQNFQDTLGQPVMAGGERLVSVVRAVLPRPADVFELAFRLGAREPLVASDALVVANAVLWSVLAYAVAIRIVNSRDY